MTINSWADAYASRQAEAIERLHQRAAMAGLRAALAEHDQRQLELARWSDDGGPDPG